MVADDLTGLVDKAAAVAGEHPADRHRVQVTPRIGSVLTCHTVASLASRNVPGLAQPVGPRPNRRLVMVAIDVRAFSNMGRLTLPVGR